jgi:hypothetical protein
MKQLGNSMDTHKIYLEVLDMHSVNYSEKVKAIFDSSHLSLNYELLTLDMAREICSRRDCVIRG